MLVRDVVERLSQFPQDAEIGFATEPGDSLVIASVYEVDANGFLHGAANPVKVWVDLDHSPDR